MLDSIWKSRDERDIIAAAQDGNLVAFDALAARYRPGAVLIARQFFQSSEAAEDAVQDSFVSAYKELPKLRTPEKFAAWLGAIVRHRCRRKLAGESSSQLPLDRLILSYAPSIQADLESRMVENAVRNSLCELAQDLRPCVELYYFDDWSVGQIADFLEIPRTTVKWRLHAARQRLRSRLQPILKEIT